MTTLDQVVRIKTPPFSGSIWLYKNDIYILFLNFKLKTKEEIITITKSSIEFINSGTTKNLLVLSDFTNVPVDSTFASDLKDLGTKTNQNNIKKSATLGVTGIKMFFASIYLKITGSKAQFFNTSEEALNYLSKY